MFQIKAILNDIVAVAYKDHGKLAKYQKFYIELQDKNLKSRHGCYNIRDHKIIINNLNRPNVCIIITTIHELAHHVDNINRGDSNHDNEFYAVYKELLYAALDMKLFSPEDFLKETRDASDTNKVRRILQDYKPKENTGTEDIKKRIEVKKCFEQKELLKQRGYRWNEKHKSWEKVLTKGIEEEESFLTENKLEYAILDFYDINLHKDETIIASEGSYAYKEQLKQEGFTFEGRTRTWIKKGSIRQFEFLCRKYPKVTFALG